MMRGAVVLARSEPSQPKKVGCWLSPSLTKVFVPGTAGINWRRFFSSERA